MTKFTPRSARFRIALIGISALLSSSHASARTMALDRGGYRRDLNVRRVYDCAVSPGRLSVAKLPMILGFKGESNWQVIKTLHWNFSERPDGYKIEADPLKTMRYYVFTWKSPQSASIHVEEDMDVQLTAFSYLYTQATLPYDAATLARCAPELSRSLGEDPNDQINSDDPRLAAACAAIAARTRNAEETVEFVCDWVNENIANMPDVVGEWTTDTALAQHKGGTTPQTVIACAMLRYLGVPADPVLGVWAGTESSSNIGAMWLEAYFPDAGWVFYDVSDKTHGYKSLDALAAMGYGFWSGDPAQGLNFTQGFYCYAGTSVIPYANETASHYVRLEPLRNKYSGDENDVRSVTVVDGSPPGAVGSPSGN